MLARPKPDEFAPYFSRYIDLVAGEDPQSDLARELAGSATLFAAISEERSLYRYAPEKWSIRQLLNHLTDTERTFAFRALWYARGFDAPLPSFDQDVAARGADADQVSWAAHVEEFRQVRSSTISLFANLPPAAWSRHGVAGDNPFSVRALAYIIAGHSAHHLKILRDRYLG